MSAGREAGEDREGSTARKRRWIPGGGRVIACPAAAALPTPDRLRSVAHPGFEHRVRRHRDTRGFHAHDLTIDQSELSFGVPFEFDRGHLFPLLHSVVPQRTNTFPPSNRFRLLHRNCATNEVHRTDSGKAKTRTRCHAHERHAGRLHHATGRLTQQRVGRASPSATTRPAPRAMPNARPKMAPRRNDSTRHRADDWTMTAFQYAARPAPAAPAQKRAPPATGPPNEHRTNGQRREHHPPRRAGTPARALTDQKTRGARHARLAPSRRSKDGDHPRAARRAEAPIAPRHIFHHARAARDVPGRDELHHPRRAGTPARALTDRKTRGARHARPAPSRRSKDGNHPRCCSTRREIRRAATCLSLRERGARRAGA